MTTRAITPNWAGLISRVRRELGESQATFGKRFGMSQAMVSYWESGSFDPPGEVTWFVMARTTRPRAGR